jgi:acid phosphatase
MQRTGTLRHLSGEVILVAAVFGAASASASATPPAWDHVVVVIEENHSQSQIVPNAAPGSSTDGTPYINELAAGGVQFNNFYAIMHPSQPNYLELYSGSNQNVSDDALPAGIPFTTPNLGAELFTAGRSFAGYSESLPSTSLTADSSTAGGYRRKHNPWVNWQGSGTNQYSSAANRDFSVFPTTAGGNFAALPNVSFVVPTQYNDMHDDNPGDGLTAIRAGDNWIKNNIKAYADWATTHNSLLIVTFDEDNGGEGNRIPTVFYGANLQNGTQVNSTWTLHNILRTLEDSNGTSSHAGLGAKARSIIGPFATDPVVVTQKFQEGASGYASEHDTTIRVDQGSTVLNGNTTNVVDADIDNNSANGKQVAQALLRFDSLIGNGAGQVPAGAIIHSAKLVLRTGTGGSDVSEDQMSLNRMLVDWNSSTATWSTFGGDGVQANGIEAAAAESFHATPDAANGYAVFDITDDILAFQAGTASNFGWVLTGIATGQDGWVWNSDNAATVGDRPMLEITYSLVPEPAAAALVGLAAMGLAGRRPLRRRA